MLANRERRLFTQEEYFLLEEQAESKSEFYHGEIFAMSGASIEHNQLVRNLTVAIDAQLRGGSCQLFMTDLRLQVATHKLFTYPDLFVVCGPLARFKGRSDTLTDATLIVEVLSQSTEIYDRGQKFLFYQTLPSLREYLLVSQDKVQAELHSSKRPGQWLSIQQNEGSIELSSVKANLSLDDIYRGVEFS